MCSCRSVCLSVQSFRACQTRGTGVKVWRRPLPAALTRQPPEEQAPPRICEMRCNRRHLLRLFKLAQRTWLMSMITTHVDMPAERGCSCSKECESPHSLSAHAHEDGCMHFEAHRSREGRRASHHHQRARKPARGSVHAGRVAARGTCPSVDVNPQPDRFLTTLISPGSFSWLYWSSSGRRIAASGKDKVVQGKHWAISANS